MEIKHWDDAPFGTGFSVSKFEDGPHKGMWGILASLPDGQLIWIALGSPPDLVVAPNKMMCQSLLANLRDFSKMKNAAKERGDWVSEDGKVTVLPDPRTFSTVSWDAVPESARLQDRKFRGGIWAVVAVMPDGEHLVLFDEFARDAGYHTFSGTREEVRRTIAYLEMLQTPPDPQPKKVEVSNDPAPVPVEVHPENFSPTPPFVPETVAAAMLAVFDRTVEADRPRLAELEEEWRNQLALGNRKGCICGQCRHVIRRQVTEILDWYDKPEVFEDGEPVSELFLDAHRLLDLLAK